MSLRCIDYSIIFALLFLAAATAFGTTPAGNYDLPPAWQTAPSSPNKHRSAFDPRLKARPWYQPRAAVGVGLGLPEVLPFEAYLFFGHYAAVRFFFTPELPVKIRIEMPADVVSTKKGIGVATPDFTINMQAAYGPHYGAEALLFPFAGSFFVGGGVSYRKLKLTGQAKTPVLICSLLEAAKDPPCGDARAAIQTETQLGIQADAFTSAILLRGSFGWFWHVGNSFI